MDAPGGGPVQKALGSFQTVQGSAFLVQLAQNRGASKPARTSRRHELECRWRVGLE